VFPREIFNAVVGASCTSWEYSVPPERGEPNHGAAGCPPAWTASGRLTRPSLKNGGLVLSSTTGTIVKKGLSGRNCTLKKGDLVPICPQGVQAEFLHPELRREKCCTTRKGAGPWVFRPLVRPGRTASCPQGNTAKKNVGTHFTIGSRRAGTLTSKRK